MSGNNSSHDSDDAPLAHDESNWLVSYADMMTLLFGFFVLMFALSRVDQEKFVVVQKDIAKYLGKEGKFVNPEFKSIVAKNLEKLLTKEGLIKGDNQDFEVQPNDDGSVALRLREAVLFAPGSDQLSPASQTMLEELSQSLAQIKELSDVNIEGHTDDIPITTERFASNWELSSARSARIARLFQSNKLDKPQIVAEGYADSRPLAPNRDDVGNPIRENQSLNRRVLIRLKFNQDLKKNAAAKKVFDRFGSEEIKPKTAAAPTPVDEATQQAALDPAAALELRYKEAQARLEEAKKKLRASEEEARKKQKLEEMERKIREMENKIQINQAPSAPATNSNGAQTSGASAPATPASSVPTQNGAKTTAPGVRQ